MGAFDDHLTKILAQLVPRSRRRSRPGAARFLIEHAEPKIEMPRPLPATTTSRGCGSWRERMGHEYVSHAMQLSKSVIGIKPAMNMSAMPILSDASETTTATTSMLFARMARRALRRR